MNDWRELAPDVGDEGGRDAGGWQLYVRRHLPPLQVAAEREAEIVDELALQLEQACHDAVAGGASQREARERALAGLPPWEELAREIDEAHSRSGRSGRQGSRRGRRLRRGPHRCRECCATSAMPCGCCASALPSRASRWRPSPSGSASTPPSSR
ncbi:MAG TPA: hypothetical protein VOA80_22940 [Thermoanaerobaculia bacterium]|nr:hypothetical protein [Thermoanaerobaculia bacterium]